MKQSDAEEMLVKAVRRIQELSGREEQEVTSGTRPTSDVAEFDSLNGVEVTVDIEDILKVEFDFNNVFIDDDSSLTIAEAAARLCKWLSKHRGAISRQEHR